MWLEAAKIAAEVIKATAWPIAVVIVALNFKAGLINALNSLSLRRFEVEALGVKAKFDAAEQQQAAAENPASEKLIETPVLDPIPRVAANLIETRLRNDLNAVEPEKREAVLLRALTFSRLEAGHEFTYNRIFGSQIAALKRLNEVGRVTVDDARGFLRPYAEQFPQVYNSNYGFDNWLAFLKESGLVVQNGNFLEITDIGRDFLIFLTERRLSENKLW